MGRVSKVDLCFICDKAPCDCNKKAKAVKPKPAKQKPVVETPAPATNKSFVEAMRAAAASAPPKPNVPPPAVKRKAVAPATTDEELVLHEAIRALAPILCEADRERFSAVISARPTAAERARAWKSRVLGGDSRDASSERTQGSAEGAD